MATSNYDMGRGEDRDHPISYPNQAKAAPQSISLLDEVRALQNNGNYLREDIDRLTKLLAETREELALLSQRTFGKEPPR